MRISHLRKVTFFATAVTILISLPSPTIAAPPNSPKEALVAANGAGWQLIARVPGASMLWKVDDKKSSIVRIDDSGRQSDVVDLPKDISWVTTCAGDSLAVFQHGNIKRISVVDFTTGKLTRRPSKQGVLGAAPGGWLERDKQKVWQYSNAHGERSLLFEGLGVPGPTQCSQTDIIGRVDPGNDRRPELFISKVHGQISTFLPDQKYDGVDVLAGATWNGSLIYSIRNGNMSTEGTRGNTSFALRRPDGSTKTIATDLWHGGYSAMNQDGMVVTGTIDDDGRYKAWYIDNFGRRTEMFPLPSTAQTYAPKAGSDAIVTIVKSEDGTITLQRLTVEGPKLIATLNEPATSARTQP